MHRVADSWAGSDEPTLRVQAGDLTPEETRQLTSDAGDAFAFINGLYANGTFQFEHLVAWLRTQTAPTG